MKITKQLIAKDNADYDVIGDYSSSRYSVVGIDARHTHIIIINKPVQLEQRLDKLNKKVKSLQFGKKKR